MTERERFEKLKDKMLMTKRERQILQDYVAMIATFAVKNNIALADAAKVGSELVNEIGQSILDRGQFEQIKAEYEAEKAETVNNFLKQLRGGATNGAEK